MVYLGAGSHGNGISGRLRDPGDRSVTAVIDDRPRGLLPDG